MSARPVLHINRCTRHLLSPWVLPDFPSQFSERFAFFDIFFLSHTRFVLYISFFVLISYLDSKENGLFLMLSRKEGGLAWWWGFGVVFSSFF
jgi:hypothetical protein